MQIESLRKMGIEPVIKAAAELQPGDVVPLFDGKRVRPKEVFGLPKQNSGSIDLQVRQMMVITKKSQSRIVLGQQVAVFPQDAVAAAYEEQVLSILRPGVPAMTAKYIYRAIRENLEKAVGQQRIKMAIARLVDRHFLLETVTYHGNSLPQAGFRQFLTVCDLPQVVYERKNHRVGWVIGFEERPPVKTLYPVVHWFNGAVNLSHEKYLEPADERAVQGVQRAIDYRSGKIPDGFVELPVELIKAARSTQNTANFLTVKAIDAYLKKEDVLVDDTIAWMDQYYPGWIYGIAPQELTAEPPANAR